MPEEKTADDQSQGLHENLETVRSKVGGLVKSVTDAAPDKVKTVTDAVSAAAGKASDGAKSMASYAGEHGSAGVETAKSTIQTYPWLSVIFALLLGFGLGRITERD